MADGARLSRRAGRDRRRGTLPLGALGIASMLIFFMMLFFGIRVYSLTRQNEALELTLRQSERERERLRTELSRLRAEVPASGGAAMNR